MSPGGDGLRTGTGDVWQVQEARTKTKILRGVSPCEEEEKKIRERRRKEKGRLHHEEAELVACSASFDHPGDGSRAHHR
jgi:hypothetical protein